MNSWIEPVIDALARPQESLTILLQLFVILGISIGAARRRVGSRLLLIRQLKPRHSFVQALTLIAGLQFLHVWLGMIGYPRWLSDAFPALVIIACCAIAGILLLWIAYGMRSRRRKTYPFLSWLFHAAALVPLQLFLGYEYADYLQSGSARTPDYVLSWPVAAACLILWSQLAYASRGVYVRSLGRVEGRSLPDRELKLLFTLRKDWQVLQDRDEPSVHYLHDLAADHYYQYIMADESDHPYMRRVRRQPPKLLTVETAATVEIPPRKQRLR